MFPKNQNNQAMITIKRLSLFLFLLLSIAASSQQQEAPIQKEYVSPDAEVVDENPNKKYLVGSGAALIVIIALAVRQRKKKNRMKKPL